MSDTVTITLDREAADTFAHVGTTRAYTRHLGYEEAQEHVKATLRAALDAPEQSHVSSVLAKAIRDHLSEVEFDADGLPPTNEIEAAIRSFRLAEHPSSGAECESCDDTGIYEEGSEWAPCGECDLGRRWAELLKTAREEAVAQGSGDSTESTKPETKGGTDG